MSLTVTEISEFGIIMLAETAVSQEGNNPFGGGRYKKILHGIRKLQRVPFLNAGISMWGQAKLNDEPIDEWIASFMRAYTGGHTIREFSDALTAECSQSLGPQVGYVGFHVAGYTVEGGVNLPEFYHVTNTDGDYGRFTRVPFTRKGHGKFGVIQKGSIEIVRNGDFGPYAVMVRSLEQAAPQLRAMNLQFPHPSLVGHLQYQRAWIRFISDLYASSTGYRTIGPEVLALAIDAAGQTVVSDI